MVFRGRWEVHAGAAAKAEVVGMRRRGGTVMVRVVTD